MSRGVPLQNYCRILPLMVKEPAVDPSRLIHQAQAARILGVHKSYMTWLTKNQKLRSYGLHKEVLREEVEYYKARLDRKRAKKSS